MKDQGIPTVTDRIVQSAVRRAMEPIFEQTFARHSYGFRPGRGCKDALSRVQDLIKRGYRHVVDADLKSYFDTINHELLMERVGEKISDGRRPKSIEPFITGFLVDQGDGKWGQFARLAGLTFAPDGSAMFLADDKNGVVYRVTYVGEGSAP